MTRPLRDQLKCGLIRSPNEKFRKIDIRKVDERLARRVELQRQMGFSKSLGKKCRIAGLTADSNCHTDSAFHSPPDTMTAQKLQ